MSTRTTRRNSQRKRESTSSYNPGAIKPLSEDEHKLLRSALLQSGSMKKLNEIESAQMRHLLLKRKIQLCLVTCNWHKKSDPEEAKVISFKRKILLEILEFYSKRKFKSLELLQQSFRLLWLNLFRALPDPEAIKTHPNDDEMDFREPSWDHLVLIYEIAFHIVTNTEIDKKLMQKHLRGQFLQSLIMLFKSLDDREPQYVKIILHAIYGRFMALRKDIRLYLSQFCFEYIYDSKCELVDSNSSILWQGIPEILAIFCSIIQGLNIPVKNDYHLLLRNVLVPLHKTYHIDAFHEELIQCSVQFILKDSHSAAILFGGLLKFWPATSPLKEQLFIDEVIHLLNASMDYIESMPDDPQFDAVVVAVINKLITCIQAPHHQVAERALLIWKEDALKLCIEVYGNQIFKNLYNTLKKNIEKYWLVEIRNISKGILHELQRTNPNYFGNKSIIKKVKVERNRNKTELKVKNKARQSKWKKMRQLADLQINKSVNANRPSIADLQINH